jgi:hypothetical protein
MNDMSKIFPIDEGDHFRIGPYYFECTGWKDGRILARGFSTLEYPRVWFEYSMLPSLMIESDFRTTYRAAKEKRI